MSCQLGLVTARLGASKYGQTEMWVEHLWLGSIVSPPGNCLGPSFFWLSLGVALDLGRVLYFAPSLRMPLVSMGLFNTARNIYCLSQLKPGKIFEKIFNVALLSEVGQIGS